MIARPTRTTWHAPAQPLRITFSVATAEGLVSLATLAPGFCNQAVNGSAFVQLLSVITWVQKTIRSTSPSSGCSTDVSASDLSRPRERRLEGDEVRQVHITVSVGVRVSAFARPILPAP